MGDTDKRRWLLTPKNSQSIKRHTQSLVTSDHVSQIVFRAKIKIELKCYGRMVEGNCSAWRDLGKFLTSLNQSLTILNWGLTIRIVSKLVSLASVYHLVK